MVSSFTWWLWYCKATLSTFSVSQDGSRPNCDNCFFLFSSIFTFTFDVYTVNDDIHWIIKSQSASLLHLDLCLVSLKRPWNLFKVDGNGAVRKVTQIASERHCCSRTSPSCAECQRRTSRIHSKATAGKREADSIDIANEPWPYDVVTCTPIYCCAVTCNYWWPRLVIATSATKTASEPAATGIARRRHKSAPATSL